MSRALVCLLAVLSLPVLARAQEKPDASVLKAVALDYIEAYYEGSAERMARALHPELTKLIVRAHRDTGTEYLSSMGAQELIGLAERSEKAGGYGKGHPQQKDIEVLWSSPQMAALALEADGWTDLMLLAHINGEWMIVEVLWATKPQPAAQG